MRTATASQTQRKLIEATRGQFQQYYETELTDADCLEIADNLTAYSNILRDIAAPHPLDTTVLDALERLESLDSRFQTRSRIAVNRNGIASEAKM